MKNFLLTASILFSIFCYAEWKQCKNCGQHHEADSSGYCQRNACRQAYQRELRSNRRQAAQEYRRERQGRDRWQTALRELADTLSNAKSRNISVAQQIAAINQIHYNVGVWEIIIQYADIKVIKAYWASPDDEAVFRRSSEVEQRRISNPSDDSIILNSGSIGDKRRIYMDFVNDGIGSHQAGTAFALGRHQRTKKIRYVDDRAVVLLFYAVKHRRADILEYFLNQMQGITIAELYGFIDMYNAEYADFARQRAELQSQLAAKEEAKANAADKFQEERIQSEIDALNARIAAIPAEPENYAAVRDVIFKYTADDIIQEYFAQIDQYTTRQQQAPTIAIGFFGNDPRCVKAIEWREKTGFFIWRANLPDRTRAGFYSGEKEGEWVAAPGFTLQADGSAKWTAGLEHPEYPGLISGSEIFTWIPDANHIWSRPNNPDDLTVEADGPAFVYILNSSQYR